MAGVSGRRRTDLQRSAGRLLKTSAEKSYDAEVDFDWDSPWWPDKAWLPEHRVSLFGTEIWDRLELELKKAA